MEVQVATIGLVFGLIFGSPLEEFLPFLAVSLTLRSFIRSSMSDGASAFITGEAIIRQLTMPRFVHVLRILLKNILMVAHNIVILPIVFLIFVKPPSYLLVLFVPGLLLTSAFLFLVSLPSGFDHSPSAVPWSRWWRLGTHSHSALTSLERLSLPNTGDVESRVIGVPFHLSLNSADMREVEDVLK